MISSSISFFKDLTFLSYKSFICLVRVIPRQFLLFVTMIKVAIFLVSFSLSLSFDYRRAINFFFQLISYAATSLKVFICCKSRVSQQNLGVAYVYYHSICKQQFFDFFLSCLFLSYCSREAAQTLDKQQSLWPRLPPVYEYFSEYFYIYVHEGNWSVILFFVELLFNKM